jgi:hypothetical protein
LCSIDEFGAVKVYDYNISQEQIEDFVGGLIDSSSSVQATYNDAGGALYFDVLPGGVDHNSLLNFVANKHIDHSAVSITAGTGLSGGGDITATRTLNLTNTSVTAGSYGSASQVPTVTVDAQGRLTAAANTSISITRSQVSDFAHASTHLPSGSDPITTAAPSTNLSSTSTNAAGTANSLVRSDHTHAISTGAASSQTPDQANAAGSSANLAKADHVHNLATAAASSLTTSSTNTQGSASSFARSDHTHAVSLVNSMVGSTTQISTTSTSYVVMTGQTLTPAAGTYFVKARANITATSNNHVINFAIFSNGTIASDSESTGYVRTGGGFLSSTDIVNMCTDTIVTVNGSQAIDMRWHTDGGTIQAQGYSLFILKLNN